MKFSILTLGTLALVLVLGQRAQATTNPKTVCYYESWVHWRTGDGKMDPSELDFHLCTHFVYSYFGIEAATHEVKVLDPYLMNDLHDLEKFARAKGNAKALISVGGSSASTEYHTTASSPAYREAFVNSVVRFLAQHQFDGIMIDWFGMGQQDSENLIALLDKFDEKFANTPYTLGITLPVTQATLSYYNVPKIQQYVDFIAVITYDYNGPWGKVVGHASPLSSQLGTLEEYHKRGAPRSKLLMSVPFFARTWRLADPHKQEIGDFAVSGGTKGPYTQTEGQLSYNELCVMIKNNPSAFNLVRDPKEHAVHAVYSHAGGTEWISFEDTKTLASKAKNITEEGYGGMVVYSLSNEDVHGVCGKTYPLLHAINDNYVRTAVTEPPQVHTIPPVVIPTQPPVVNPVGHCHGKVGKFRDSVYCFQYYDCQMGDFGSIEEVVMHCERHQAWDGHACVEASQVPGCH